MTRGLETVYAAGVKEGARIIKGAGLMKMAAFTRRSFGGSPGYIITEVR